jgi:hypothetical protein
MTTLPLVRHRSDTNVVNVSAKLRVALIWIKHGEIGRQVGCNVVFFVQGRKRMKHVRRAALAASAVACAALFSFGWSEQGGISLSVESAQARVGRPLTPVSVAGVARRQTRRAVYGAGIAGAAVVGTAAAVAAAPYYGGAGYYSGGPYYQGAQYYARGPYAAYGYPAQDYATRNGFVCQPGTLTKLDDGRMYPCQ